MHKLKEKYNLIAIFSRRPNFYLHFIHLQKDIENNFLNVNAIYMIYKVKKMNI